MERSGAHAQSVGRPKPYAWLTHASREGNIAALSELPATQRVECLACVWPALIRCDVCRGVRLLINFMGSVQMAVLLTVSARRQPASKLVPYPSHSCLPPFRVHYRSVMLGLSACTVH